MRVAVLSDIHGFNLAFAAVLADLEDAGPFDEVVIAGDLVETGPGPAEVLDMIRAGEFTVLTGNTDRDLVTVAEGGRASARDQFTIDQVMPEGIAYLAELPISRRITPPGGMSPDDDLLVVHANPHDLERPIRPELSEREVRELIGDTRAAAIAFGHIHIAYVRRVGPTLLVDVSAVGNPKDGDLRCKYGILTWDAASRTWRGEIRRTPYPLAETIAQIEASALPKPAKTRRQLEQASY